MGIKFPTPWKTPMIKFPTPRDGRGVKCPGYARGGGHVEASIWPIHYKEKESEKRAWNARYALHDKYPWDVGLGKLVSLTIPVLPIRETMTRSLPVYVHAIVKTKTNHVLVILIISDCRSLRHVLSFVKPLERRWDFFPVTCSRGFCTCTCYHYMSLQYEF